MLLSGGIDSATCLYLAKKEGDPVRALTVKIHGTAGQELAAARRIAKKAKVLEHRLMSVPELREAADIRGGGLRAARVPPTYIPMKNAVYYSLAAAYADEKELDRIVGGHNKDDALVFGDTSEEFFGALESAIRAGSPRLKSLEILRPLKEMTKTEVVALAYAIGVPLGLTWSCHKPGMRHCWKCEGCKARRRAFESAGVEDPLARHG